MSDDIKTKESVEDRVTRITKELHTKIDEETKFPWIGVLSIVVPSFLIVGAALIVMYSDVNVLKKDVSTKAIEKLEEKVDDLQSKIQALEVKMAENKNSTPVIHYPPPPPPPHPRQ